MPGKGKTVMQNKRSVEGSTACKTYGSRGVTSADEAVPGLSGLQQKWAGGHCVVADRPKRNRWYYWTSSCYSPAGMSSSGQLPSSANPGAPPQNLEMITRWLLEQEYNKGEKEETAVFPEDILHLEAADDLLPIHIRSNSLLEPARLQQVVDTPASVGPEEQYRCSWDDYWQAKALSTTPITCQVEEVSIPEEHYVR
ncbi:hypothetical protein B7463_g4352, partial [Scytalidium lignicola]